MICFISFSSLYTIIGVWSEKLLKEARKIAEFFNLMTNILYQSKTIVNIVNKIRQKQQISQITQLNKIIQCFPIPVFPNCIPESILEYGPDPMPIGPTWPGLYSKTPIRIRKSVKNQLFDVTKYEFSVN